MAKKPSRPSALAANDDIGEELRLRMYRMQVEIRAAEQRAFDLFLQNLVKGTSHLSLGQEAVAVGFLDQQSQPWWREMDSNQRYLSPYRLPLRHTHLQQVPQSSSLG